MNNMDSRISDYLAGMSLVVLSKKYGVSRQALQQYFKSKGIHRKNVCTIKIERFDIKTANEMRAAGYSLDEIAHKTGLSKLSIIKYYKNKLVLKWEGLRHCSECNKNLSLEMFYGKNARRCKSCTIKRVAVMNRLRPIIMKRDNMVCQKCGRRATEIHHLKSWIDFPLLREDLNNIIALCHKCHMGFHAHRNKE